jgi:hypothetical protein
MQRVTRWQHVENTAQALEVVERFVSGGAGGEEEAPALVPGDFAVIPKSATQVRLLYKNAYGIDLQLGERGVVGITDIQSAQFTIRPLPVMQLTQLPALLERFARPMPSPPAPSASPAPALSPALPPAAPTAPARPPSVPLSALGAALRAVYRLAGCMYLLRKTYTLIGELEGEKGQKTYHADPRSQPHLRFQIRQLPYQMTTQDFSRLELSFSASTSTISHAH